MWFAGLLRSLHYEELRLLEMARVSIETNLPVEFCLQMAVSLAGILKEPTY